MSQVKELTQKQFLKIACDLIPNDIRPNLTESEQKVARRAEKEVASKIKKELVMKSREEETMKIEKEVAIAIERKKVTEEVLECLSNYMNVDDFFKYLMYKNPKYIEDEAKCLSIRTYFRNQNLDKKKTQEKLLRTANSSIYECTGKYLSDTEKEIIKCFWTNMSYKAIIEYLRSRGISYAYGYLSREIGINLMKKLSKALNQNLTKKSFKKALEMKDKKDNHYLIPPVDLFVEFLIDAIKNNKTYARGFKNRQSCLKAVSEINVLKDIEIEVLYGIVKNKSYIIIADCIKSNSMYARDYSYEYIGKDIGAVLCKKVSVVFGIEVTKKNFVAVFKQWKRDRKIEWEDRTNEVKHLENQKTEKMTIAR